MIMETIKCDNLSDDEVEDWSSELDFTNRSFSAQANVADYFTGFDGAKAMSDEGEQDHASSVKGNELPQTEFVSGMPINRMALNDHKAGMSGLDKERINRIIYENSKGSLFFENERKKEARVKERVSKLHGQLKLLTEEQKCKALKEIDKDVDKLEQSRDLSRTIVHIDMDAFYAAVEMRDNPELKEKPMAVGGMGMLSTSNYVARRYGVRAGMPGFIGKKLCPELILVPPHFDKYREVSEEVKEVLRDYDPNFSMGSMDEAYLDITDCLKRKSNNGASKESGKTDMNTDNPDTFSVSNDQNKGQDPIDELGDGMLTLAELVVNELRGRIYEKTQLTASAGIASNTMLAKICSDRNKPNGQFYLQPYKSAILKFMRCLPIRKVFGIGRVSEQVLNSLGVMTCQDMFDNRAILKLLFSPIAFNSFLHISLGISSNKIGYDADRKSISTETTFGKINEPNELISVCKNLCSSLAKDVESEKIQGKSVTVKLKLVNFEVKSRCKSLTTPISSFEDIFRVAKDILQREIQASKPKPLCLRLMGVRLAELSDVFGKEQNKIDYFLSRQTSTKMLEDTDQGYLNTFSAEKSNNGMAGTSVSRRNISLDAMSALPSKDSFDADKITEKEGSLLCPVCCLKVPLSVDINDHIDSCLNTQVIEDLTRSQFNSSGLSCRKRKRISDSMGNPTQTLYKYFSK